MAMVNENIVIRLAQDVDIPEVKQLLEALLNKSDFG
ncbi:Uncharacterised protein [Klebsiella pneumoniae]|nr:Uncharacterised protein [Klebsiella pneumoniae]